MRAASGSLRHLAEHFENVRPSPSTDRRLRRSSDAKFMHEPDSSFRATFVTMFHDAPGGGLGRYERSLLPLLRQRACVERRDVRPFRVPIVLNAIVSAVGRDLNFFLSSFPGKVELACAQDVVHFTNQVISASLLWQRFKGGTVVTVHDIIPVIAREFGWPGSDLDWLGRLQLWMWTRGLSKAQLLITPSDSSKQDLIRLLRIPSTNIRPIYQGVDHERFHPRHELEDQQALDSALVDPSTPFVLYVGSLHHRKNLNNLLVAFAEARRQVPSLKIVFAGSPRVNQAAMSGLTSLAVDLGIAPAFQLLGPVTERVLAALYRAASVFVLPSRYEGFGLPAIEAMACGCPTICSDVSSLPEVVGDAGILVSPDSTGELASAISEICSNRDLATILRERGVLQSAPFTWESTAAATVNVYREINLMRRPSIERRGFTMETDS